MAEAFGGNRHQKKSKKYLCGTPTAQCIGINTSCSSGMRNVTKSHNSPQEAFRCYSKYLLRNGYQQIGSREFTTNEGPIVVLTKKSRFGAKLKSGKGNRMISSREHLGGTIISM